MKIKYFEDYNIRVKFARDYNGNNPNKTGYGSRIKTDWIIKGDDNRLRRVYAICYSNVASYYVTYKGERYFIRSMPHD